jgi:hypothetical protein
MLQLANIHSSMHVPLLHNFPLCSYITITAQKAENLVGFLVQYKRQSKAMEYAAVQDMAHGGTLRQKRHA